MRAINAAGMRRFNRQLILNIIRKSPTSRGELAQSTGLTRAAVAQIVDQLIVDGIVSETAPPSRGQFGRRSAQLSVIGTAGALFGVKLSGERCDVGAINLRGDVLCESSVLVTGRSADEIVVSVAEAIARLAASLKPPMRALGAGLCVPNARPPDAPPLEQLALRLAERTQLDVRAERETNARTLEQHYFGGAGDDFALLDVSDAVYAGVMIGERPLRGAHGSALSLGRAPVSCNGSRQTLDDWLSVPALLRGTPYSSWAALVDSAGEPEAAQVLQRVAAVLAAIALGLFRIFGVRRMALSGELAHCPGMLLALVNESLQRHPWIAWAQPPVIAALEPHPVRTGAMPAYHAFFTAEPE